MSLHRRRPARLAGMPGIGVDRMGDAADALADRGILRLENLDTDIRPYGPALAATRAAVDDDAANSYLPFLGQDALRRAAAAHVGGMSSVAYDWRSSSVISAGGLSGILNALLATVEAGDEVITTDPIYVGLLNRIRLAGAEPRLAPLVPGASGWRLDLDSFRAAAASPRARAVLLMSPSMPTGAVLTAEEWEAVAEACRERDLLLIYDAAMERILFDGRKVIHPAGLTGMAERTVTVGSASRELRMIGWRIGWIVGPPALIADIGLVGISNVVCQVGLAMAGAAIALEAPARDVAEAVAEWQRRRDLLLGELDGVVPAIIPHGGWSMLLDVGARGLTGEEASRRLLREGGITATAMADWGGPATARYLRLVFANEPLGRLAGIGERLRRSLAGPARNP